MSHPFESSVVSWITWLVVECEKRCLNVQVVVGADQ
jgi:hypothetical protein